jgi:cytoskeletal protein CcmA (bactofilin family)
MVTKNKKRRIADSSGNDASIISDGSVIKGELTGNVNYVIAGKVDGNCDIQGTLMLQEQGSWKGTIVADFVVIAGQVDGDVRARDHLELTPTARIAGDITGKSIAIAEGAIFDGSVTMTQPENVSTFEEKRQS